MPGWQALMAEIEQSAVIVDEVARGNRDTYRYYELGSKALASQHPEERHVFRTSTAAATDGRAGPGPHAPAILPRLRRRARQPGPGVAAEAGRAGGRGAAPRRRPAGPAPAAFPGQGQERHLPVHGRRPEPAGAVRA